MSTTKPGVRQARALATRRTMIDVAVRHFGARPYNEVSVSAITGEAGVADGLLFRHFGSKRGLYLEAVKEMSQQLFALQATDPDAPPGVQLRDLIRQHFMRVAEHEDLLIGYVRGSAAMAADPEAWAIFEQIRMDMVQWTCRLIGVDLDDSSALRLMMRTAGDVMDRLSVRWLEGGKQFDVETMVETMIELTIAFFRLSEAMDPGLQTVRASQVLHARTPTNAAHRTD